MENKNSEVLGAFERFKDKINWVKPPIAAYQDYIKSLMTFHDIVNECLNTPTFYSEFLRIYGFKALPAPVNAIEQMIDLKLDVISQQSIEKMADFIQFVHEHVYMTMPKSAFKFERMALIIH